MIYSPKGLKGEVMDNEREVVKSKFKSVCVFCGSSIGKRDCYRDAAIELAQELVKLSQ